MSHTKDDVSRTLGDITRRLDKGRIRALVIITINDDGTADQAGLADDATPAELIFAASLLVEARARLVAEASKTLRRNVELAEDIATLRATGIASELARATAASELGRVPCKCPRCKAAS